MYKFVLLEKADHVFITTVNKKIVFLKMSSMLERVKKLIIADPFCNFYKNTSLTPDGNHKNVINLVLGNL
jgi:hypothetical protein